MIITNKIQESLSSTVLKKKLKYLSRAKHVHNFDTAKAIGIIFPYTEDLDLDVVKEFLDYIAGKKIKVFVLAYSENKKISDIFGMENNVNVITRKDFNWFHKPLNPIVKDFTGRQFDILIDLNIKKSLHMDYIMSLSRAKFKTGRFIEKNSYYDLMIDIKDNQNIKFLIEQLKHYLTIINHN